VPIEVVPYEASRRADVAALMREVWGEWLTEAEFSWWFEGNPAGPPLISLAEEDGRLVGVACMSPYRLSIDGEFTVAPVPLHVATHPDLRGRGIFTALEEANERRAAERFGLALTFPNEASRRVFVSQFGWTDLRRPRIWTRPARGPSRLLRGVEQVDGFGRRADELWRALASSYDTGLVRDGAYLDWRFASSPRGYVCLASAEGIAVVGHRHVGGRDVAYVAELVARPGRATRRLLRACLAVADASLLLALPPRGHAADLARAGFVPTTRRILVMAKQLRPGVALSRRWTFSLGDGDSW
jgi:GNAT superfamily N-acetyltransferase